MNIKSVGIDGPYTSASNSPTFEPLDINVLASIAATVDFPTPPLQELTAIICLTDFKPLFSAVWTSWYFS